MPSLHLSDRPHITITLITCCLQDGPVFRQPGYEMAIEYVTAPHGTDGGKHANLPENKRFGEMLIYAHKIMRTNVIRWK